MTVLLLLLIVLGAMVTEAIVGFGSTVLTVALGAHLLPLNVLLPAYIPVNMLLSAFLLWRQPGSLDRTLLLRRILPAVGIGMVLGLLVFRQGLGGGLLPWLAGFVIVLAVTELIRLSRATAALPAPVARYPGFLLLLVGGIAHGLFGSGGPMVVYVTSRDVPDKSRFRGTLAVLWLILNGVLIGNYAYLGLFSHQTATLSLAMLPVLLLAAPLGDRIHGKVHPGPFRIGVYVLLLLSGVALAARSFGAP